MDFFLLLVIGLIVGSFLAAFTYRYPQRISVLAGRSFCPNCRRELKWHDNIPLLSFILLKGKCRNCQKPISLRYPIIELTTGLVYLGIWYLNPKFFTLIFLLLVFSLLIAIFVIDLENKVIPDELIFFGFGLTLFSLLINRPFAIYSSLAAGFGAAFFLLILHLITHGRGMGLGDVKFAIFGGSFLGWPGTVGWLFLAFLTGAVTGLILVLVKKLSFGKQIAFGPFLVISLAITFFWGEKIIRLLFY